MKNFEQIRAQNALKASGEKGFEGANNGEVVKKIPTMISESGLLGALAFACEGKEKEGKFKLSKRGYAEVFIAFLQHLAVLSKHGFPVPVVNTDDITYKSQDIDIRNKLTTFADKIASADELRTISSEAMAYLNYLKRFALKSESKEDKHV